ncbi:hypothetical protein EDB89DRAFT_2081473 [Lactarius sanguifluus]|nr:hypothetical protein EDB89DRAFT_2081473 [Lactarius sanguifluus]
MTTDGALPPCPQNKLTSHPPAKSTAAQKTEDTGPVAPPVPSEPTQTPAAASGPSNIQNATPTTTALTTATSKKQKTATALAEPTGTIAIKNFCMYQWNEQQPGGQGLAADFDVYFKGLSDMDKEPGVLPALTILQREAKPSSPPRQSQQAPSDASAATFSGHSSGKRGSGRGRDGNRGAPPPPADS